MKNCNHDKAYSNMMLMSNPPQRDWICRVCGEKGRDTIGKLEKDDYVETIQKFKET